MYSRKFVKLLSNTIVIAAIAILLTGCQSLLANQSNNDMLIQPNQVVTKRIPIPTSPPPVKATYPLHEQSQVIRAYQKYSQRGVADIINGDGFITYPFDQYSKPIVQCAPSHLCIVQLQQGEVINDIALGDSAHWQISTALIGTGETGAYQVSVKPSLPEIATDLVITTDQRSYHLGLVSEQGKTSQIVSFYYPEQTLQQAIKKGHQAFSKNSVDKPPESTNMQVNQLNFNYRVHGNKAPWKPTHVFDDGQKTFIQMPPMAARTELPVLYVSRNHEKQLVNYRYRQPYFIIDSLFERAYLIAGKGKYQTKVIIDNQNWQQKYLQHDSPMRAVK